MGYVLYEVYKLIGFVAVWAVLMILSAFITVRTFTLMPMSVFPYPVPFGYQVDSKFCQVVEPVRHIVKRRSSVVERLTKNDLDELTRPPLKISLKNGIYISQVPHRSIEF